MTIIMPNYKSRHFFHTTSNMKKRHFKKHHMKTRKQKGKLFPLLAAAIPAITAIAAKAAPAIALSAATGAISGAVSKAVQKGKGRKKTIKNRKRRR